VTDCNIFRKLTPAIALIAITLSCSSTKIVTQAQQQADKPQPQVAYGNLIFDSESEYIMIPVLPSEDEKESTGNPISSFSSYDSRSDGPIGQNMIFYNKTSKTSHILLNKKALISKFEYLLGKKEPENPSGENAKANPPKQTPPKKAVGKPQDKLLLFHIIDSDTNADGKLDGADAVMGYLSNSGGKSLQVITPPNTQVVSSVLDEKSGGIFITIRKDSDGDRKFTEKDQIDFVRVDVSKPGVGQEIIDSKTRQELQQIMLNSK
jgi:hypothetical protein